MRLQNQHLSVGHAAEMPLRDLFHGISQCLAAETPKNGRRTPKSSKDPVGCIRFFGAACVFGNFRSLNHYVEGHFDDVVLMHPAMSTSGDGIRVRTGEPQVST